MYPEADFLHAPPSDGCPIVGFEMNTSGVKTSAALTENEKVSDIEKFGKHDALKILPYGDNSFDANYPNDVMRHVRLRKYVPTNTQGLIRTCGRFVFL